MSQQEWTVYLSGEIHNDWRERIIEGAQASGMAAALGKPMISLHDPGLNHALKEVDGAALAVAETPEQVVQVPTYAMTGKL